MLTVTDPFRDALEQAGAWAVYLVELPSMGVYQATASLPAFASVIRCGTGLICGTDLHSGQKQPTYETRLSGGATPSLRRELDDRPDGSFTRVSVARLLLASSEGFGASLLSAHIPDNAPVRVLMGFKALRAYSDFQLVFTGILDNLSLSWDTLELDILDASLKRHRNLSVPLGSLHFPSTPQDHRGEAIPILIGRNTDVETIPVIGPAQGTLAFAITDLATSCLIREFGAPFPSQGTITLGSESGVTYTSQTYRQIGAVTYTELSGLTRGAPVAQSAGVAVTLTNAPEIHLVGYSVGQVTAVRDDTGVIDPADYTVYLDASGADRPVTLIQLDNTPTGTVVVDADGANVDTTASLTNGDFETGDTTGWTTDTGSTATVSTGNTYQNLGTYKLELEGDEGVFTDFYQDFTTVPGRSYSIRLAYRDSVGGTNLLTNPGFDTGDLTGWTLRDVTYEEWTSDTSGQQLGAASASVGSGEQAYFHVGTGLPGSTVSDLDRRFFIIRPSYNGLYRAEIRLPYLVHQSSHAEAELYQDVTVTASATYQLVFGVNTRRLNLKSSGTAAGSGTTAYTGPAHSYIDSYYRLGTPADPDAYAYAEQPGLSGFEGTQILKDTGGWRSFGPFSVVPTDTTLRVAIGILHDGGSFGTSQHGVNEGIHNWGLIDSVSLVLADPLPVSASGLRIGSDSDPDAYADLELPQSFGWTTVERQFTALTTTTRVTLRSKWTELATASHFDDVQIVDGGRNPADAIKYVIETFIPEVGIDEASFTQARGELSGWQFGARLPDPGDSRELLARMAAQCKSRLIEGPDGKIRIQVRGRARFEERLALTTSNLVENSLRVTLTSLDACYTDFQLWFGLRGAEGADTADYQASVFAFPEGTSHPGGQLDMLCQQAERRLRARRRLDMTCEFIRDLETAHALLEFLVQTYTERPLKVDLDTGLEAALLEVGDRVTLEHPLFLTGETYTLEVLALENRPDTVHLTLRNLGLAGFYESWEPPSLGTEESVWEEDWTS